MSPAKKFRLATVERLRGKRLEEAAQALHTAQTAVREAEARRDDLVHRLQEQRHGETTAYELELEAVYRFRLRGDLAEVEHELAKLTIVLEQRRETWLQARAEVRAVGMLHDRYREERAQARQRAEQREMDERAGSGRRMPAAASGNDSGGS
ncbi:flagellar export protein FliJ [Kineosporia sp. J2-2]|uniref:Flagellar FliJ protein n=1 Tax=Kineosporia corallincola TaxID=2835133 RepID=A0ABS5TJY9_9ACTN|nr:flagellar export protein FliJ [Kineosporia corallincola]MBT0771412.1 flagellar export protein FliJ [Kineosporia corallincola]